MIALQLAISYRHDQNVTDYFLFCGMATRIGSTVQFRGEFPVGIRRKGERTEFTVALDFSTCFGSDT